MRYLFFNHHFISLGKGPERRAGNNRPIEIEAVSTLLVTIFILFCCVGCYKDKGNYNYKPINDIAIQTPDSIAVRYGDTLKINPLLGQAIAKDESSLKYEWNVVEYDETIGGSSAASDSSIVVLSNTRNLNMVMTSLPAQSASYAFNYKVTDTTTGITYRKLTKVLVFTPYQIGWMVLEQENAKGDISFINTAEGAVYHNAYSAANPNYPLPSSVNQAYSFNIPGGTNGSIVYPPATVAAVMYNNGGYLLNSANLKVQSPYTTFFYDPPSASQPQFMAPVSNSSDLVTINAGHLHRRFYSNGQQFFSTAYTTYDGSPYYLAPFYAKLYFDTIGHRFLQEQSNSTILNQVPVYPGAAFDVSNVPGKMLAMAVGFYNAYQYAIIQDPAAGNCSLYALGGGFPQFVHPFDSTSPGIDHSPAYLFSRTLNQIYYAADNNIYAYDVAAASTSIIYSFSPGENISTMQSSYDANNNASIIAATYNGHSGNVYFLALDNTGQVLNGTYTNMYSGFGKVVSMCYHN